MSNHFSPNCQKLVPICSVPPAILKCSTCHLCVLRNKPPTSVPYPSLTFLPPCHCPYPLETADQQGNAALWQGTDNATFSLPSGGSGEEHGFHLYPSFQCTDIYHFLSPNDRVKIKLCLLLGFIEIARVIERGTIQRMASNHHMGTDLGSVTKSASAWPPSTWPSKAHPRPQDWLLPRMIKFFSK